MLTTIIPPVVIALLVGLGVKLYLDRKGGVYHITKNEFIVCAVALVCVTAPATGLLGWHFAKANLVTYTEYRNGWENAAIRHDTKCVKNGSCYWSYDCDPYQVYVSATCTDSDGNSYECGGYETRYHSCPYVDVESTFVVGTTLGSHTISANRFPANPQGHRWRRYKNIPDHVIDRAGTGIPKYWQTVKDRVEAGTPKHATSRVEYLNYILASDSTILKQRSTNIEHYIEQKTLPPIAFGVSNLYDASKVHFIGYQPEDSTKWQEALNRLNGAVGRQLEADIQIVIVQNAVVDSDPDTYTLALKAYWQDASVFGKNAFSKNGIGIVIGTDDGETISWARSFTGMPLGNESMIVHINKRLKGQVLDSSVIIGETNPITVVTKGSNQVILTIPRIDHSGIIASILYGDDNKSTRFERIGMTGKGSGKGAGFLYLFSEISPTEKQKLSIAILTFIFGCLYWTAAALIDMNDFKQRRSFR